MVGARQRLFSAGDGIKLGLWLYILLPPLGWLVVAAWPQGPERFGLQWQALGCGIACALFPFFLDGQSFRAYWDWLKRSKVWLLLVLGLIWLGILGLVHGFWGLQLEGLLSGFLFLMLFPVACFAWAAACRESRATFAALISALLLLENFFLSVYMWRGLGFGVEVLDGESFPRIFLHVRDGNTIAVAASVVAFEIFFSARNSLLASCLLTAVFFNGWITAGRGVFLSAGFAIVLVALRFNGDSRVRNRLALLLVCSASALGLSWLIYYVLALASGGDQNAFQSMIGRLVGESQFGSYGRIFVWREWLCRGLRVNALFGTGLGVKPNVLLPEPIFTPHNIFVQLLSEGGVFSGLFVGVLVAFICMMGRKGSNERSPVFVYGLAGLFAWLNVSAMTFWPLGVWIVSNIGSIYFKGVPRGASGVAVINCITRVFMAILFLFLLSAFVAKKISLWY